MKLHKRILCGILLCFCFLLTGCGNSLIQMTDAEEEQVVLYAAKIVSKFNRAQDGGYAFVNEERKQKTQEKTPTDEEQTRTDDETQENEMSFSDIIGIEGVTFTYEGYDVTTSFHMQDIAIPDAEAGYSYLILKMKAENTTDQDLVVDLLNNAVKYKLSINDDVLVDCLTTLSMSDLSTYYNKAFSAGSSDDTVLIFQTKTEYLEEITSLTLQVTKDGQTYHVKL